MLYKALYITEMPAGRVKREIRELSVHDLPPNDVLIEVKYSSLNYKDALSATGNKGVTKRYPHTPGIDAAGIVKESKDPSLKAGDQVIVTGYDLGMNTPGGFGQFIRVPVDWVVPLPENFTLKQSMMYGTAGFTAALSLYHLLRCGQSPSSGPVLVTGATGGVGSIAVALLAKAGFEVWASTGKPDKYEYLQRLGAARILPREETDDMSSRALLKAKWSGAIDTVGGNTLATVLKACAEHGNVACCGNVQSPVLNTTVFPFILNGVTLIGINTATTPMPLRKSLWKHLAGNWQVEQLPQFSSFVGLEQLSEKIDLILQGKVYGRIVLDHQL